MDFSKLTKYLELPRFRHRVWDTKINHYQLRALTNNIRVGAILGLLGALLVAQSSLQINNTIKALNVNLIEQTEIITKQLDELNRIENQIRSNYIRQEKFNNKILRFQRIVKAALVDISVELGASVAELGKILLDTSKIKTKITILSDFTVDQIPQMSAKQDLIIEAIKASTDITVEVTTAIDIKLDELLASSVAGNGILATLEATTGEMAVALDVFSAGVIVPLAAIFEDYMNPIVSLKLGYWKIHLTGVDTDEKVKVDVTNQRVPVDVKNFPEHIDISNFPELISVDVNNFPIDYKISNFPESFEITNFPDYPEILDVNIKSSEISVPVEIGSNLTIDFPEQFNVNVSNFPVDYKISNFPDSYKVSNFPEWISIANFPDKLETINIGNFPNKWDVRIIDVTIDIPVSVRFLPDVTIDNFPADYKVNNFPDSYKVNNFPEWISIANFPDKLETINIGNFPYKWDVRIIDASIDVPVMVQHSVDINIGNYPELPTVYPVIQTRELSIQEPVHVTLEGGFIDGYMVVEVLPHPSLSCCNTQFYKILTELATIIDIKENNCLDMYLEPLDFTTSVKIPFLLCNGVTLSCDMSYLGWTILGINYDQICEPYIVSNPGNYKVGTGHIDMEAAIEFGYTSNHLFLACTGLDGDNCDKYKT